MGIKIFTKVYEDTNSCEVSSNRKYITEQFHKLMQEKNVKEITAIKRKRFVFTVENKDEMTARINDILDATPEVAVRSKTHSFFSLENGFGWRGQSYGAVSISCRNWGISWRANAVKLCFRERSGY